MAKKVNEPAKKQNVKTVNKVEKPVETPVEISNEEVINEIVEEKQEEFNKIIEETLSESTENVFIKEEEPVSEEKPAPQENKNGPFIPQATARSMFGFSWNGMMQD